MNYVNYVVIWAGLSLLSLAAWMVYAHYRDERGRPQPSYDDDTPTDPMIQFAGGGDLMPAVVYVQSKIGLVELIVTGEGTNALVKMSPDQARNFAARVARESHDAEEMLRRVN